VGIRPDLDEVDMRIILLLPGLELRPLDRPARSQSLYRLSCPGCLLGRRILSLNQIELPSDKTDVNIGCFMQ
jgi:hypothetical protein